MKRSELRDIILEAYTEILSENQELPTNKDILLGKFPTLKKTVENLFTKQYDDFIKGVDWVAPKPSTFRIILKNEQVFYLKWLGKQFQAQIEGKRYILDKVNDFQQALDKLSELLKQSEPVEKDQTVNSFEEPATDTDFTAGDSTAGDFDIPAEEPAADDFEFEEPGEEPEL
jgi:hypothetical protein